MTPRNACGFPDVRIPVDRDHNGEVFLAFVEQAPVPTLRPGDMVIMENLGSHKVADMREAMEAADAGLLFPPHYGLDLNLIEMAFAKLKAQSLGRTIRTMGALWNPSGN